MKVLTICVFPPMPLPEADHAFHIVQHLADTGITVEVLTTKGSVEANHPNVTQFSIMEKWDWKESRRLAQHIKRSQADAVLLYYSNHLYHDHPMITFAPTIAHAIIPKIPFVTIFPHFHGVASNHYGLSGKIIHKAIQISLGKSTHFGLGTMLRDSSKIIVLSEPHLQELIRRLPQVAGKSTVIPPPPIMPLSPDTKEVRDEGRKQLRVTDDMFLFAYFGYLYPGKGLETLIQAFSNVAAQNNSVRLAIIGSASPVNGGLEYAEKIRQLVAKQDLCAKVTFTGGFSWDSMNGSMYLRAADACVLPFSGGVQMNNSSFAAAVCHGLPVITTQGIEVELPFVNDVNVSLCLPEEPESLTAAMLKVTENVDFRHCLHTGALTFADEFFSWKSATRQTLAALEVAV